MVRPDSAGALRKFLWHLHRASTHQFRARLIPGPSSLPLPRDSAAVQPLPLVGPSPQASHAGEILSAPGYAPEQTSRLFMTGRRGFITGIGAPAGERLPFAIVSVCLHACPGDRCVEQFRELTFHILCILRNMVQHRGFSKL